ncbi:MAG: DegT/DnrJ/EryC1/StrS family aminotransferase [Bacteroidales bacterium]|jgi:dTDP-4-amino-4,6-dideoxygalactose transaminase|nr:DegT/DnrJ/EryC1/StrS family aminotransferase [Bacteroidales bacterium]
MKKNPIYVTKPYLPPLEEFIPFLEDIWNSHILTNCGHFHKELENKLCDFLGVKYISLFSNGTLALITAIQALKMSGEVITTPFSFVATVHALWWNGITPVFADIEPVTFNLDPNKIEAAITPGTTAILPVHVYGNPCNTEKIQEIAERYGLKVIYDAAHAFNVKVNGTSITNFGDLSVLSFHATKVFNTFEGGAIICHDEKTKQHIDQLKNFGITDEVTVVAPGINAKMNEFQAAIGILQLKYIEEAIYKRKAIAVSYREILNEVPGITVLNDLPGIDYNYAYFPVFIDSTKYGRSRDELYENLRNHNIFCRRYFYPLISQVPTYRNLDSAHEGRVPVAEKAAKEVLCLPIYPDLGMKVIQRICKIILSFRK